MEIMILDFLIPISVLFLIPPFAFFFLWPSDTDYLRYLFPQFVKSNLYHLCYTSIGQRISICNYWNGKTDNIRVCLRLWPSVLTSLSSSSDPHHRDLYVNSSDYLAVLNSERANPNSTGQQHLHLGLNLTARVDMPVQQTLIEGESEVLVL